jgi:3-oxoadipate enol-lactonase/4-carboxymuconolactone decarboxylase
VATVTHEGATIAYRVDGPPAAPALVLANSLGTSMAMWDDQIDTLAQRFRVVRFDHRGHGGSSATPGPYSIELLGRDALAVLDGLEIEAASICGLSIGGAVAMWIAANAPGRVERLVVCCSARRIGPPEQWAERAALVRAEGPVTLLDVLMQRWFTPAMTDPGGMIRSRVRAMLETVDAEGYAGCCEALGVLDLSEQLGAIEAPTLVLAGALDPVITPEVAYDLADRIKGSSLMVLADAAHLANMEQPARVTEAVLSHLCGPAAERGDRVRRRVLGDEHVDRASQGKAAATKDFQDLVGRVAWGEIWTRPGLDPRTRSCITVAMLVALGRFDELELHIAGAERNGVSRDEIVEVLLQAAIYCGFPAANSAFAVARKVFGDREGG